MKEIAELKKCLYKDILLTIFVVLISIPIWLNFDVADASMVASSYDNYNYIGFEMLNDAKNDLKPSSDSYAMNNVETQDIMVYNYSNTNCEYKLILKINKNVETDNIKINVNYDVDYLSSYPKIESGDYNVFIIDNDYIKASSRKYIISMWMAEEAKSFSENVDYVFEVI